MRIIKFINFVPLWVGLLVITVTVNTSIAQEEEEGVVVQPGNGNELTQEQLLFYLANEKVVAAGTGFLSGQIDDPMSSILTTWGEPLERRKTGFLGRTEFLYQPDPNTLVVFTGKERVISISVKGNSASLLRTRLGARFGSTPLNIIRMYSSNQSKTKNDRLEFKQLGINFHFVDNKVEKIVVYPRD